MLGFSTYFVLRDLLLDFLRRLGITKERMIMGLMLIAVALNVLGVYYFLKASSEGAPLKAIRPFLEFLVGRSPLHSGLGLTKFMALCGASALLTVITFGRQRSYLE
jgi:hypothetical protein